MRPRVSLRAFAIRFMLLGMFALLGHNSAVALGLDRCLDGDVHSAAGLNAGPQDDSPSHHSGAMNTACCVGACTAAIVEDRVAIAGQTSHGAPQTQLPPSGFYPGGLERPPRV